ncbi:Thermostable beta-glucosidase B [Baekduia alba]|uniref:glycoside hydrolase family 3 C-terminal domain-containing protein n=1 Tax=Baekduia alba TaxID=2997333 RepID=UPI00234155ED|nr:glycoside hydrolase family 3 C-terminal domain-containing protein [Baekduia alba]WCB93533.1 Thermostable beta-glucosidase B [Baekduia alba]
MPLRAGHAAKVRIDYSNNSVPPAPPFRADLHLGYAPPDGRIAAAVRAARRADVAVVFANTIGGETMDQSSLALPGDQDALVEAVAKANRNTVVVLHTGGPVLTPWRSRVAAIVEDWYPGERSGDAIARVLFGDVDPSGRLPLTFPASAAQGPATRASEFPGTGGVADHDEGLDVGYRFYDAHGQRPAFPFGFGLSYTSFRLGRAKATGAAGAYAVSVPVRNTGRRPGTQTVQVYASFAKAAGEPPRRLVGFAQVTVPPGQTRTAKLTTDPKSFQVFDAGTGAYALPAGPIGLAVGTSSRALTPVAVG